MTYPPQQPGQPYDPYQQQPAQPPQFDPYAPQQPQPPQDPYAAPQSGPPAPQSGPPVHQDPYAQPGVAYPPQQPGYDPYGQPQPVTGGPAYGQPAYGQPSFGQPAQPPSNKKLGLLLGLGGGGIALLALIIVLVVVLSGGGPGDTVDDYLSALQDHDYETANSLVCSSDDFITSDVADIELEAAFAAMSWDIVSEYESGTSAIVTVTITGAGEDFPESGTFELIELDGDWCIDEWT